MKLKRTTTQQKLVATLNLTSLIDVVFLLIIFFMLSSSFVMQPGIRVDLPKSRSVDTQKREHITITITKDGALYVNEEKVTMSDLPLALVSKMATLKEKRVLIKPDTKVETGTLVQVMGIAKSVGIESVGIATRPGETTESGS